MPTAACMLEIVDGCSRMGDRQDTASSIELKMKAEGTRFPRSAGSCFLSATDVDSTERTMMISILFKCESPCEATFSNSSKMLGAWRKGKIGCQISKYDSLQRTRLSKVIEELSCLWSAMPKE